MPKYDLDKTKRLWRKDVDQTTKHDSDQSRWERPIKVGVFGFVAFLE